MTFYRSKPPREHDKAFNLTILWYVARYRHRLVGVYYFPDTNNLHPVLDLEPGTLPKSFFEEIDDYELRDAVEMICIPRCGACCEVNAGGFVFDFEARALGLDPSSLRCEDIELLNGVKTRICELPSRRGRCIFYDVAKRICRVHSSKPTICLVTFCSIVGRHDGRIVVRTNSSRGRPIYVPWTRDLDELARYVRNIVLRLATEMR